MSTETRLSSVERRLEDVTARLRWLEGAQAPPKPSRPAFEQNPLAPERHRDAGQAVFRPPPPLTRERSTVNLEELLGGRVLAWVGGLAILLGAVLFMAMAIGNGWIDEATRTVIAFLGSAALLVAGVWLHESKGRTEAARAAVASALAGLYATLVVATQTYDLVSTGAGLAAAALVAAVGLGIAVRWSSSIVAAIGMLGALGAPLLVGTGGEDASIAFVGLALAAGVGILLWQRWDWLALGAFALSAPQLIDWAVGGDAHRLAVALPVLLGFWALYVAAAIGHELRTRDEGLMPLSSWLLLFASAALVSGLGYYLLYRADADPAGVAWILGLSASYVLMGGVTLRLRLNFEIGSMLIGAGLCLSALGLADALDGPALVAAWAVECVALAYLAGRSAEEGATQVAERLAVAAGLFLAIALVHVVAFEAPPNALLDGVDGLGAAVAGIGLCAAAALAAGRFVRHLEPAAATITAIACAASLVYLGSVVIVELLGVSESGESLQSGQVWLSVFWTGAGLGALVTGLVRGWPTVRIGGLALLGLAIAKVWTYDLSELDEIARVLSFIGLGLLLLVGAFAYQRIRPRGGMDEGASGEKAGVEA